MPSLQDRRNVNVGSTSFFILMRASRIYARLSVMNDGECAKGGYHRTSLVQVNGVGLQSWLLRWFVWVLHQTLITQRVYRCVNTYPTINLELLVQYRLLGRNSLPSGRRGGERSHMRSCRPERLQERMGYERLHRRRCAMLVTAMTCVSRFIISSRVNSEEYSQPIRLRSEMAIPRLTLTLKTGLGGVRNQPRV